MIENHFVQISGFRKKLHENMENSVFKRIFTIKFFLIKKVIKENYFFCFSWQCLCCGVMVQSSCWQYLSHLWCLQQACQLCAHRLSPGLMMMIFHSAVWYTQHQTHRTVGVAGHNTRLHCPVPSRLLPFYWWCITVSTLTCMIYTEGAKG